MPEHRLHTRERMVHALVGAGAEDGRDVVGCRIHRLRRDPHQDHTAFEHPGLGVFCELPSHTVDDRGGVERSRMQPHPFAALPPVAVQLHPQLGAHQGERGEAGHELLRRDAHAEGHLLGDLQRRLERHLAVQLGRRHPRQHRLGVAAPRQRMQPHSAFAEPFAHAVGVHRGEGAEGVHSEPGEQLGVEAASPGLEPERGDRQRSEEPRGTPAGTTHTGEVALVPTRAACSAVKGPSAMPARTSKRSSSPSTPRSICAASASPP